MSLYKDMILYFFFIFISWFVGWIQIKFSEGRMELSCCRLLPLQSMELHELLCLEEKKPARIS